MNRRSFLRATAALGTGSMMATVQGSPRQVAGQSQAGPTMQHDQATTPSAARFFQDDDFNFVFLTMLGGAYHYFGAFFVAPAIRGVISRIPPEPARPDWLLPLPRKARPVSDGGSRARNSPK